MEAQVDKLRELIEGAQSILITSHISPDPDAVSSLLLMGTTLRLNFPDKKTNMVLEEEPLDLNFLDGYAEIKFQPLTQAADQLKPDLFILLDGNNYERCSRLDGAKLRQYISENQVNTAIIDHHELVGQDNADVYINLNSPATAQTCYEILFKQLGLKQPPSAAETAMVGFYADTGGLVYLKDGQQAQTLEFAKELINQGVSLEQIKNQLVRFSDGDIKTLSELLTNVSGNGDYTYSYLRDEYVSGWLNSGHTQAQLQRATGIFLDEFVRNIDGRQWGFIVYKNTLQGDNYYSVSLRAVGDVKDVSLIANQLGGGGHKPAAGAKFTAASVEEALQKVKQAVDLSARPISAKITG